MSSLQIGCIAFSSLHSFSNIPTFTITKTSRLAMSNRLECLSFHESYQNLLKDTETKLNTFIFFLLLSLN